MSVHLPAVVRIVEASPERPYLGLKLKLDQRDPQMMVDGNLPVRAHSSPSVAWQPEALRLVDLQARRKIFRSNRGPDR